MLAFLHFVMGGVTSLTITTAVQVDVLLLPSVARSVTVLLPILAQVKVLGVSRSVKLQLSVLILLTEAGATVTEPLAPRFAVKFLQRATGAIKSRTVTLAVQLLELPLWSVPVSVTVLVPRLPQV